MQPAARLALVAAILLLLDAPVVTARGRDAGDVHVDAAPVVATVSGRTPPAMPGGHDVGEDTAPGRDAPTDRTVARAAAPGTMPVTSGQDTGAPAAAPRTPSTAGNEREEAHIGALTRPLEVVDISRERWLTGPESPNDTDRRWNVHGTDLGHTFLHGDALYMVFGDTYGPGGPHRLFKRGWRSNVMARIGDPDPRHGLPFTTMITGEDGTASELLDRSSFGVGLSTVIPTGGISVNDRMILHYMAVTRWGDPGRWDVDHAGLAYSDDDGNSWTLDRAMHWSGDGNFAQVAFVRHDDTVYVFGIPAGRFGGAALARVPAGSLQDPGAYEYWDGSGWVADADGATLVVPAPVGELSVRWSDALDRWLMLYLDEDARAVVLRTADDLTGPWSDTAVVAHADEYPQLYAPFLVPWDTGEDVYFTMSQFGPYNVALMRARLAEPG